MKIEWLNSGLTEARLTRGWWFWKETAEVRLAEYGWMYKATGSYVEGQYSNGTEYNSIARLICDMHESQKSYLSSVAKAEFDKHQAARNANAWQKIRKLPKARLLTK